MTTIRRATLDDLPAVRAVGLNTVPAAYGPITTDDYIAYTLTTWWSPEAVTRSIEQNRTWLAERDGHAVGTATAGILDCDPILWKLMVLPDAQRTGAGAALVDIAREPGMLVEYVEGNERAAAFYRAQGFRHVRRDEPATPGWPAMMWMRLP